MRRVLPLPLLDRPPTAPPVVAGLFRYQDRAVPVLRLDILFGLEPAPPTLYTPLLLVDWGGRPLALLAGRVFDIVPVAAPALLEAEAGLSFNGCAVASFRYGAGNATLLDPERLLTETEGRLLAAFQAIADDRLAQWQAAGEDAGDVEAEAAPRETAG